MKKISPFQIPLFILLILVNALNCFAKKSIDLEVFLTGTSNAYIELTQSEQSSADINKHPIITAFADYLKSELKFQSVAYTTEDKKKMVLETPTLCDIATIRLNMNLVNNIYKNIQIRFRSCLGDGVVKFTSKEIPTDNNLYPNLKAIWKEIYSTAIVYNPSNRLEIPKNRSLTSETNVKQALETNSGKLDFIEGIYEKTIQHHYSNKKHKIAILKAENHQYKIYYLGGITNYLDWVEGEFMGTIPLSGDDFQYENIKWITSNKKVNPNGKINFLNQNAFELSLEGHQYTYKYHRVPTLQAQQPVVNTPSKTENKPNYEQPLIGETQSPVTAAENNMSGNYYLSSTGSAIAISQDGYIITNHHVVANHDYIELMIPNSFFGVAYRAVIICSDESTDLALLKIEDIHFHGLPTIPYHFRYREADVGEDVFTLGFPLVESMGWDIKLGDGLISSRKGYKDDPKTYQISVPVQSRQQRRATLQQKRRTSRHHQSQTLQSRQCLLCAKDLQRFEPHQSRRNQYQTSRQQLFKKQRHDRTSQTVGSLRLLGQSLPTTIK